MITVNAASAIQDTQSSMENALTISIVDKMDILDMVNAIARKDTSGFLEPADLAVLMKPSMVLFASALLDMSVMSMESVLDLTSTLTAMITKDMTLNSRLAFVFKELLSSEENANPSQAAQLMPISTVFNASATLDSS
jgi:hypothetical protein